MSLGTRTVTCREHPVDLTSVEFNVLELLLRNAGNVVTREQIAEVALGRPLNAFDRSVDVHVSRLRKKLGTCRRVCRGADSADSRHRILSGRRDSGEEQGMNRRLFWKIFLPFWVAQALLAGRAVSCACTTASTPNIPGGSSRSATRCRSWPISPRGPYEEQGPSGLQQLLDSLSLAKSLAVLAGR